MKRFIFLGISLFAWIALAYMSYAAAPEIPRPDFLPGSDLEAGKTFLDYFLNDRLPKTINMGVGILGLLAFISIIVAAILMLTSWGNEDQLNRAKTNFRYAITGFAVILFSYAIISIVVSLSFPENSEISLIPSAHALDVDDDVNILLPSQEDLIENQDEQNRVSLPSGDLLSEVIPAAIVNLLYIVGLLLVIALLIGGSMLVFGWGSEESVSNAKRILIYGAYAIALLALGYALIFGLANLDLREKEGEEDEVFTSLLHLPPAAVQLDPDLKPDYIPDYQAEEAISDDHPESAATQTLIIRVGKLISRVLLFTAGLSVCFLIIAGANYIAAFGKDARLDQARRGIFWSITGLVIILLSYAIIQGAISIILQTDASVR